MNHFDSGVLSKEQILSHENFLKWNLSHSFIFTVRGGQSH
jgi:hypothetical protein